MIKWQKINSVKKKVNSFLSADTFVPGQLSKTSDEQWRDCKGEGGRL